MCEADAERSCLSSLAAMGDRRFAVAIPPPGGTLRPDRHEPLPRDLVATLVAVLSEPDACLADTAALQVWVDEENRINAVKLLLGSP